MAHPEEPLPVKYFVAVLFLKADQLERARQELAGCWGEIDFEGDDHHFDVTDYYTPELGAPLYRRLLAFRQLYTPTLIVDMKLECNLDHNKYLLASAKEAGQKVYLDKGIYADLSGRYKGGKYQPFEWSFPDFRDGRYDDELLAIRRLYMGQLKQWRTSR